MFGQRTSPGHAFMLCENRPPTAIKALRNVGSRICRICEAQMAIAWCHMAMVLKKDPKTLLVKGKIDH